MTRFIEHTEIDKVKWDDCIVGAVNGLPYAYSWYMDTITGHWGGMVYGDYDAVLPLAWRKKWGIKYIYQPFFTQQFAVFTKNPSGELEQAVLTAIPGEFKFIDIKMGLTQPQTHYEIQATKRVNYTLSLSLTYDVLYAKYNSQLKRNIRKAVDNRLHIVKNIEPERLIGMFRETTGHKTRELKDKDYYSLEKLMYKAVEKGMGEVTGVFNGHNEMVSGGFFVHAHNRIINLFPASTELGRTTGAMPYLIDYIIQTHAATGKILDFEGSMIPTVARFYKSFGAAEDYYWQLKRNQLPWGIRQAHYAYNKLKER